MKLSLGTRNNVNSSLVIRLSGSLRLVAWGRAAPTSLFLVVKPKSCDLCWSETKKQNDRVDFTDESHPHQPNDQ